jgi:hypothetical protein
MLYASLRHPKSVQSIWYILPLYPNLTNLRFNLSQLNLIFIVLPLYFDLSDSNLVRI